MEGPIGPRGFNGSQGATGQQGPQGVVGPQGPQGDIGSQGFNGSQGPRGFNGSQGLQGPTGAGDFSQCVHKTDSITGTQSQISGNGHVGVQVDVAEPSVSFNISTYIYIFFSFLSLIFLLN